MKTRAKSLALIAGAFAVGITALPASADTGACMQTNYTAAGNTGTLGCTANDVKIAQLTTVTPAKDSSGNDISGLFPNGDGSYSCIQDSTIQFTGVFSVVANASQRYDVGLYIAGQEGSALVGTTCNRAVLTAANSTPYDNYTVPADACGDVTSAHSPYSVTMPIVTKCVGSGTLNLPNATSWLQKETAPCKGIQNAVPGTTSKCNYIPNFPVNLIQVQKPKLQVSKAADQVSVDPGTTVTYTVTVNNASTSAVTLTSLTESVGTNVSCPSSGGSASGFTQDFTYNFAGSNAVPVNCNATTLAAGASTTCTFSRVVTGNPSDKVSDNVCVSGTSQFGAVVPVCGCTSVSINDVKPTAQVNKSVTGAVCTTVRFQASVKNTDQYNRPLSLTGLSDSFYGQIASSNSKISATTCQFPQTLNVSDATPYTCTFDAQVCSTDLPHNDTITAALSEIATGLTISPTSGQPVSITGITVVTQ